MAIDNLNYLSSGLPAGQLTDKYSNLPGCLKSKNLDIFSSSKSVKATAFSAPVAVENDIIKQDGNLILKTDGKVYERTDNGDILVNDPSIDFPVHQVSYTGKNGTYTTAQWGTPQDMSVKYEGDQRKSYTVFTDRAQMVYSNIAFTFDKEFVGSTWTRAEGVFENGYKFTRETIASDAYLTVKIKNPNFGLVPIKLYCTEPDTTDVTIYLAELYVEYISDKYYYDAEMDTMVSAGISASKSVAFSGTLQEGILVNVPVAPSYDGTYINIAMTIRATRREGKTGNSWSGGNLFVDINGGPTENHRMIINNVESEGDYKEYYSYLPIRDRKLTSIGNYGYSESYWMKGASFQPVYKWIGSWVDDRGDKKTRYDFITDMGWANDPGMDVIGMIIWNEQVYMIGNLKGDGYIIPCDLTGGVGTPYIAYGCTFTGVANIDYLLYLVGENRGISNLWVYNGQELVSVIGGNKEKTYNDIIDLDEQYKFDGKIVNWRKNLILSTEDNRLFQYGQTYGGKGGSFIHQLPSNAVIKELKANGNDLEVEYSITASGTTTNYKIKYQDDTPIKNYNTEWEATYPIVIGNHLLEKEESDLYASYVIPHSSCKLEFWGNANHYTYWSFKVTSNFTPPAGSLWDIQGLANGLVLVTTRLEFVEKNGEWLTFRLVGEMPVMSGNETGRIIYKTKNSDYYLDYTEVNHFRKIGEITADKFTEGEFRFHNLNNKLELPKSHSLQIMVRGKGTANYTPELFSLDLVANQRDRG